MTGSTDLEQVREREKEWQNRQGGALQEDAYERSGTREILHRQFERIERALGATEGRVLDLGCGVGHLLSWLSKRSGASFFGMDLSFASVRRARQSNPKLHLVVADAEALPFRSRSFERISCNGVAHHLLDLDRSLTEVHRVLSPGGLFVLFEPVTTPIANLLRRFALTSDRYESPADLAHKHEFSREFLRTALSTAGFSCGEESFHDFLAYPLTGMYREIPTSHWPRFIAALSRVESRLERIALLRSVFDFFSWRLLVTANRRP